jgi:putative N6-adenine-specific DNA methylase
MPAEQTRGGRKLEAALAAFAVEARVRGAHAIDVGASTGGFVAALLAHGATHVTAVDVGHDQLLPELARDARVTSLERTDFKTLSLAVAPGPFDFFTVDVSFVAGRTMLRGLAFRLRPGAEGVVLVKPQFEVPGHLVRGGKVDAPALRQRALASFAAKATRLGFEVLHTLDSPVPGGSGTVEILAHLRFAGRPDTMPQPGERKPPRTTARKAAAVGANLRWFAVASPGLEAPLRDELASLPAVAEARAVDGGVEFAGPLAAGMAANLHSRIATRIVARLGEVRARDFAPLRRSLAKLPWPSFVPRDRPLRIDVATSHCRLYHTGALAETVALAIADCVGPLPPRPPAAGDELDDAGLTRVLLRGRDDRFLASVDASGDLLHRRGWRLEAGAAPLRETLAAGILALAGYDPRLPLVDPMCGSGTIAIEAARWAAALPPGGGRAFAFERWPLFDADAAAWRQARAATADPRGGGAPVFATDRDARAVDTARRNALRAQVAERMHLAVAAFGAAEVPTPAGLVVINPPYGRRLGQRAQAARQGRDIGQILRQRYGGWRAAVLCPDAAFVAAVSAGVRKQPTATHALRNGGLRVQLGLWQL